MTEETDAIRAFYDKAFAHGHQRGYSDAVTTLWELAQAAYKAGDHERHVLMIDVALFVENAWPVQVAR